MTNRLLLMAAAFAVAAPLGAAPALAQGSGTAQGTAHHGSRFRMENQRPQGGETSKTAPQPASGGTHMASMHHGHHAKMAAKESTAEASTDKLNGMSLTAARQGQSFTPPPPAAK